MVQKKPVYVPTLGEEVANAVSHGVMSLVTLLALPFAAVWAYTHDPDGPLAAVSVSIFVISIFLMFLASTLYHSMNPSSRHKEVFHILDHIFIYVAIAGSYTPIALSVIGGWQGVLITVLQWAMVLFGIFYKSLSRRSIPAAVAHRRRRRALHAGGVVLRPQGVPLPPHGVAPAHQPGGRLPLHRHRLLPLLIGSDCPGYTVPKPPDSGHGPVRRAGSQPTAVLLENYLFRPGVSVYIPRRYGPWAGRSGGAPPP